MSNPFKYNPSKKEIEEVNPHRAPKMIDGVPYVKHHVLYKEWKTFEKSKLKYPAIGEGWKEDKEYVEGRDFELKWEMLDSWEEWIRIPTSYIKDNIVLPALSNKNHRQAAVLINNSTVEITKEKEEEKLIDILDEARLQIEYLHNKFGETGSGNNVISRINQIIDRYK